MTREQMLARLRSSVDENFYLALIEFAILYGWEGDYTEVDWFVNWVVHNGDRNHETFHPYEFEGENCEGELTDGCTDDN